MNTLYLHVGAANASDFQDGSIEHRVANKHQIDAILKEEDFSGKKVFVIGNGENAHDALVLAYNNERNAIINGESIKLVKNCKDKISSISVNLLLLNYCNKQEWFVKAISNIVFQLVKKCPSKFSVKEVMRMLHRASPDLEIESTTAKKYALEEFKKQFRIRRAKNKARISIYADGESVIEMHMRRDESLDYVLNHPAPEDYVFLIDWPMDSGKTTNFTKKLFDAANEENKTLLMTSSITLTNGMCPSSDPRNYKTALFSGTINNQSALASTTNSAILGKAFADFRESINRVIFEEYESCRDSIISDVMGNGSLRARTEAQERFNELLTRKLVVCVDAQMSQESADHILRTTGRKIIVIKATDLDGQKQLPEVDYYSDRNSAINAATEILKAGDKLFTFCDALHSGGKSKVRSTEIQIAEQAEQEGREISSLLIDASFFGQKENEKRLNDLTSIYDCYDHVISTSALKNGCNIMTQCSATLMLGHQTILPLDFTQQSRRTRLSPKIISNIRETFRAAPVSIPRIFELELGKNIKEEEVDATRLELSGNQATKDIINRIQYLNKMRNDYINNVLDIYELQGYKINYNYCTSSSASELSSSKVEKAERLEVYAMLQRISQPSTAADIRINDDEIKSIDEMRIEYANDVYNFFKIDAADENCEKVFNYDKNGLGRKFINNLHYVRSGFDRDYLETSIREQVLKKLFECLGINVRTLKGNFTKSNCDAFQKWVSSASIKLKDGTQQPVKNLFEMFFSDIKTSSSTWLVKNLLKKHLGLNTEKSKNEDGNEFKIKSASGKRENALCINAKSISQINFMYELAHPSEDGMIFMESHMKVDNDPFETAHLFDSKKRNEIASSDPSYYVEPMNGEEARVTLGSDSRAKTSIDKILGELTMLEESAT